MHPEHQADAAKTILGRSEQRRSHPCVDTMHHLEDGMERDLTPIEARGGVISGRIFTVLAISVVGAVIALAVAWAIVGMPF